MLAVNIAARDGSIANQATQEGIGKVTILGNKLRRVIVSLMAGVFVFMAVSIIALAQPPANDACDAALFIPNGGSASADNTEAVTELDDPEGSCWFGANAGSIFFEFTAAADTARIRTTASSGRDADFAIYAVDPGSPCDKSLWVEMGCSEDDDATFDRNTDVCIAGLTINETYTLMLVSFSAASLGDYTVEVDSPCVGGAPAVCGDGTVDGAEQCDDGNTTNGDGCSDICEIEDLCPADPAKTDPGICGCGIPDTDSDSDGTADCDDICADTVIPEAGVPSRRLGVNRFALVDNDGDFDTTAPKGRGRGPGRSYTIQDTAGCSCEQIIAELGLGQGHTKFGCSIGAMEDWLEMH